MTEKTATSPESGETVPAGWRGALTRVSEPLRRFNEDAGLQLAGALSFSTLLALVPLIALGLSVLVSFPAFAGARERVKAALLDLLAAPHAEQASIYLDSFVERAAQLTGPGLLGLAVTAILLLLSIHNAMARIFKQPERRSLTVRLLAYWAIISLGPILIALSLSLTAFASDVIEKELEQIGAQGSGAPERLLAFLVSVAALMILYLLAPARRPRVLDALVGAAAAALMIELLKHLFGLYLANFTSYEAIYGALAVLPALLLWIYMLWIAVLLGAETTACRLTARHGQKEL